MGGGKMFKLSLIYFLAVNAAFCLPQPEDPLEKPNGEVESPILVLTVATNQTDGFVRYMRSAERYGVAVTVVGMGERWDGGDMNRSGGGHKVNLLRSALKAYKHDSHRVVLITDAYDVVFTAPLDRILEKFLKFESKIVFSAEIFCWPDIDLADKYPPTEGHYEFLNSGGFIGYASDIYELLSLQKISNRDDDQLFFTTMYLNEEIRKKYNMKLDHSAVIFQNTNAAEKELLLVTSNENGEGSYVENTVTGTRPLIVHGNGPNKLYINSVGNYIGGSWDDVNGCTSCRSYDDEVFNDEIVLLAISIVYKTPFLEEFFQNVAKLKYDFKKIHLFVYNNVDLHQGVVDKFLDDHGDKYASVKTIIADDHVKEDRGRQIIMDHCLKKKCDFLFVLDSLAMIDRPEIISRLIQHDKGIVGPLLPRYNSAFTNFWGAVNKDGFYSRSFDYFDIINNIKRGVWNVPYLTICYLVKSSLLDELRGAYEDEKFDADMAFSSNLRKKGIHLFVDNTVDYGHLINPDSYDPSLTHPEVYQVIDNQIDWEKRYLHENYSISLRKDIEIVQPCPDVYWFPVMTPRFCRELIDIMENFGKWSSGSNHDERLNGGYENVPTRDIHMNQVGLEKQWLHILGEYIRPVQEKVFLGYFHDPPKSLMNFVVRYKPDEQPSLRPHHDSSTYTINLALNKPNVDYTGGGCHFLRYNCSVTDMKVGWTLMHPGRLTHFHEGLKVLSGTRYIMISFIDP